MAGGRPRGRPRNDKIGEVKLRRVPARQFTSDQKLALEFSGQLDNLPPLPVVEPLVPISDELAQIYLSCGTSLKLATKNVCDYLLRGVDLSTACLRAGYRPEEIIAAMHDHEGVFRALNQAWAENVIQWISPIRKAAEKGDWRAAAFYLERALPSLFAEVKTIGRKDLPQLGTVPTNTNKPIANLEDLSDEELVRLVEGRQ